VRDISPDSPLPQLQRDPTLLQRRPLYVVALLLAVLSLPFQLPLLFLAGMLVAALAFVPEIWYRWGFHALAVERHAATSRVAFGDAVEVTLTIENRKPLPLPWLELDDEFPEMLPADGPSVHPSAGDERVVLRNTVALWAYQRLRRRYMVHADARGVYPLGPITLRTSDPFGILQREATLSRPDFLIVHPLVAPLERFGLPPNAPFGERKSPRRLLEDPLRVAGVRDYTPGDEPRRIHWKATARVGALQSKVYEPATRHAALLLLDVRTLSHALMGYDPKLVELAVTAAASVATWATEQQLAVGIFSNGTQAYAELEAQMEEARPRPPLGGADGALVDALPRAGATNAAHSRLRIPISSASSQLTRVLDGLARLLPYYGLPMERLIVAERSRIPFGATVVYIGAQVAVDVPLIVALRQLKLRGHAVTLLLTRSDAGADAGDLTPPLAGLPAHTLGDRTLWDALAADVLGERAARRNVPASTMRAPGDGATRPGAAPGSSKSTAAPRDATTPDGEHDVAPTTRQHGPRALVVE
jgi:uncharacterized protein (DUF58 family)